MPGRIYVVAKSEFIKEYQNRIINIHPSLLPSFKECRELKIPLIMA